jgi:uncharacterized protein YndB with AHSA1/START domain
MSETRTAAVPAIFIRRTFKAPRARVFAAWTDVAQLLGWFGPPGAPVIDVQLDLRVGGTFRYTYRRGDGCELSAKGVFTEVSAPERLAFTWRWEEEEPSLERETSVRVEFLDRGNETEMLFTHEGFADEASRGRHEHGWNGAFDQLEAFV